MGLIASHYLLPAKFKFHLKQMYSRFNRNNTLLHYLLLPTPNNLRLPHVQRHRCLPKSPKTKAKLEEVRHFAFAVLRRYLKIEEVFSVYLTLCKLDNSVAVALIFSVSPRNRASISIIFLSCSEISLSFLKTALLCAASFFAFSFSNLTTNSNEQIDGLNNKLDSTITPNGK